MYAVILSCFLVDYCQPTPLDQGIKLVHSEPRKIVRVETLPYVSNLQIVVSLQELTIDEWIEIELQLYDNQDRIIAFTEKNRILANKSKLKTYCTLQTIHCKEGKHKLILFINGKPVYEYNYTVESEDNDLNIIGDAYL